MVVKMSAPGRSFGGVADYCLHDPRMPGEAHHPESAERVEWTETRNLATSEGERAGRIMAATAEASPELNRSKLKLSKWAEEYERGQGEFRCPAQVRNNARRGQGKRVQDRVSRPTGRHRRAEMNPQREQRQAIPAGRVGRSGSGWPGSGQRSAGSGSSFRGGVARRSGNWRNGASGSGRRFTGVTSSSGNTWRKIAEGRWGASGYGGSWAAKCERSAGRSGETRKCWDASGRSWRTGCQGRSKFGPLRRSKSRPVGEGVAVFVGRLERSLRSPFRAAQA